MKFTLPLAKETCEQGLACAHFIPSSAKHMWKSTLRTFREYGADTTVIVPCSTFQIVQTWVELRSLTEGERLVVSSSSFLSNVELIRVAHYGKEQRAHVFCRSFYDQPHARLDQPHRHARKKGLPKTRMTTPG